MTEEWDLDAWLTVLLIILSFISVICSFETFNLLNLTKCPINRVKFMNCAINKVELNELCYK